MTNEVSNIIKGLCLSIDTEVFGVYDSVNDRTNICNTKWMRIDMVVENSNGDLYRIITIEYDEWVTWQPVDPLNTIDLEGVITLPSPYWITGTQLAANREWTISTPNLTAKLPLVWLLEVLRMRKYGIESTFDFDADVRMFFLDQTNITQYYTEDHRNNVMYPMEKLCSEFLNMVNEDARFVRFDDYELITFSRFGTEQRDGMFANILDANLSGVELRIRLIKYKANCIC
jgi:hypothetical protein